MQAAVALMVTRISDDRSVQSATAPSSMAWTSSSCSADHVVDSDDDGSGERCRCSTGRVLLWIGAATRRWRQGVVDDGGCHAWVAAGGFGRRRQCGCSRRSWLLGSGRVLLTLTSGCCRADGVGESDDDGSDERCRCSTGRRWGLPRVGGSWRLRTQATMWM